MLTKDPLSSRIFKRVNHADQVDDLVRTGKDVEKLVLARGLRNHLGDRIMVAGEKQLSFELPYSLLPVNDIK